MRKPVHLLFIIGLISWGMVLGAVMNGAGAYASMHVALSSPEINSLRTLGTAGLPRSAKDSPGAGNVSAMVALTFDDGPQPIFTPQILSVLQLYGVQATFFCIGSQVQEYPESVRNLYESGNVIGNHAWSHPDLTSLSPAAIRWQIGSTSDALRQVTGVEPTLFRPPYGATNATVRSIAAQLGLAQIAWTIDTDDCQRPRVDARVSPV